MNIEIRDPEIEARLRRQLEASATLNLEDVLLRLLETQEEQDRWLAENRSLHDTKIGRGIEQLDRGEGIPEDELDAYLSKLKSRGA